MRNLKRVLSLTLASVMLVGMMVVGSNAAAGYDDVSETDNVEAIEVLQAIEVMVGDERGFGPERPVNRAEMAVVMGKLLSLDYNYYTALCPFTDVYDWAQGWVGACYANKIVSGRGDGIYDPSATVTAVEAASMLMRALGYFQYQNDYTDGFELATVTQGKKIGIFDNVGSSASEPMTRNQVAQMVLNALQSAVVEPDGNTINLTTPDGSVITGKVNYVSVTSNKAYASAISNIEATSVGSTNDGWIVELGERLYDGKLKLDDNALDPFKRPSREWEYDGKVIGIYAKKELMVFDNVGKVVGTDLYNLLGANTLKDYDLFVAVDGINNPDVYDLVSESVEDNANSHVIFGKDDLNRNNKAKIGATGTGVLTQVFVDHERDEIYVAIINTYLAIADKAYDEKKEEASVEVFDIDKNLADDEYAKTDMRPLNAESEKFQLGVEDFDLVKDIAKDDAYLVTVAEGEIQTIVPAEVLAGVSITSFKKNDFVVSGGTTYNYTTTAGYNHKDLETYTSEGSSGITNLKDRSYNIYLDAYGNLIGLKEVDAVKNYVFIASIDRNGSYIANKTANATAIFLDGTSEVISIDMTKSTWQENRVNSTGATKDFINGGSASAGSSLLNTWCTYTKSGDVYTVREVVNVIDPTTPTLTSTNGVSVTNGTAAANRAPGTGANANGTDLAQFHDVMRSTEITLKNGLRLNGGFTAGSFSNIYGDSDSVYLTAELGTVRAADNQRYGIIKGAETVYTGIDGTNISIWTKRTAQMEANKDKNALDLNLDVLDADGTTTTYGDDNAFGVYTLYDDEGIIIASMIVGEGSSSKDWVYVTSKDASLETWNGESTRAANGDNWTWEREVVRNGEKVVLTEVGDTVDALSKDNMKQYHWYEIKTDGNGNVTSATPAFDALDRWTGVNNPTESRSVFVGDYKEINNAVENEATDIVLYHESNGTPGEADDAIYSNEGFTTQKLEIQGKNVLAVTGLEGSGIYFRNNVHVVLEYWNRNVDRIDVMVGEGVDDLKDMVDYVNENTDAAQQRDGGRTASGTSYYLSALIEDGAATTIVIHDRFNNYNKPGTSTGDSSTTAKGKLTITNPDEIVYISDKLSGDAIKKGEVFTVTMTDAGYTINATGANVLKSGSTYTVQATEDTVELRIEPVGGVIKDGVTLTLKGGLSDAEVWNGSTKLTGKTETTADGSTTVYTVEKGTTVQVKDTTDLADAGSFYVNGELLTVASSIVKVTMDKSKTLTDTQFDATEKVIAVHAGPGVTLKDVKVGSNSVAADKITKTDTVWYVTDNTMNTVNVQTTDADSIIMVSNEKTAVATQVTGTNTANSAAVYKTGTKAGAQDIHFDDASGNAVAITGDVWLYAAAKVDMDDSVAKTDIDAKVGETAISGAATYVKVGEQLSLSKKAGGTNKISGAIVDDSASGDVTTVAASENKLGGTYGIGTKDIKVYGAYTVTLLGVQAQISSGGANKNLADGDLIKAAASGVALVDTSVKPVDDANAALEVIDITNGNRHGAAYDDDADITGDITLSVATKVEIKANAGADMTATYKSDISGLDVKAATCTKSAASATAVYVLKGTVLEVVGEGNQSKAITVKVDGTNTDPGTGNSDPSVGWVRVTVGEKAISVEQA